MRIESVSSQPDRVGKYKVCLEDGSVMRLYRQTVQDFGLFPGLELTDQELDKLRVAAGEMSAKMRAVRIVAASSVSKKDLEQRLVHKGETPEHARRAVEWMSRMELVDDRKTAEQVVQKCISKGYGLARAKQALYEKRIPKEFWQEALEDYPDQTERIADFLRSRLTEDWDEKELRKATDVLLRRGHSYTQIRQALRQLSLDDELQEEY